MKKQAFFIVLVISMVLIGSVGFCAYHHEGERDAAKFLAAYPDKAGTKLDHCALCHSGGEYEQKGQMVKLGSCQWCHYSYGYNGAGNIADTMNAYGNAYKNAGRNADAVLAIDTADSDGDGYTNGVEIKANRFPGDPNDDPSKQVAPSRVYTRAQLEAMPQHTQFLLMNTSRSGDFYAEYTGVVLKDLLADAGILSLTATGITVFSPDGWAQYHPLEADPDPELYHVNGEYPETVFYYKQEADEAINTVDGWCDYSAPSCRGRNHLDPIVVPNGLRTILAYKREGAYMDPGVLNLDNKLDGEGPFRVVPPQQVPSPPDQSSRATNQPEEWFYDYDWDHNAGASTRTVTIIRVEPLPPGTTDINVLEAGWNYVDQAKIIIYGAIDGTDSNNNGILDSEEKEDPNSDFDGDGKKDYEDPKTAKFRYAYGDEKMLMNASEGAFANVQALANDDPSVPTQNKPSMTFPYGITKFEITGLTSPTVTVTMVFPGNVPTDAKYYKIDSVNGWHEVPFGSNDGDNQITLTLTDGDSLTDADGDPNPNGTIVDPGAVAVPASATDSGGGGDGGCFVGTALGSFGSIAWICLFPLFLIGVVIGKRFRR